MEPRLYSYNAELQKSS